MKMKANVENKVGGAVDKIKANVPTKMFKAVMKCGGIVKKEAAGRAPSSKIAKSIKVVGKNVDGSPESNTGMSSKGKGWYGKFFESGAKRHEIKPKKGKILSWLTVGGKAEFSSRTGRKTLKNYYITRTGSATTSADEGRNYTTFVNHPGMKRKPFLVPAYRARVADIKDVLGDAIVTTMAEAVEKG